MFTLICTRINGWVNNGEAGDMRRYRAHYDVTVMLMPAVVGVTVLQPYYVVQSFVTHFRIGRTLMKSTDARYLNEL